MVAPPMTLSPDVDVSDAIDQSRAENRELALVVEDGDVTGTVTTIDSLESVTADTEDLLGNAYGATVDDD